MCKSSVAYNPVHNVPASVQVSAEHTPARGEEGGKLELVLTPVGIFAKINFKRKYIILSKPTGVNTTWESRIGGGCCLPNTCEMQLPIKISLPVNKSRTLLNGREHLLCHRHSSQPIQILSLPRHVSKEPSGEDRVRPPGNCYNEVLH